MSSCIRPDGNGLHSVSIVELYFGTCLLVLFILWSQSSVDHILIVLFYGCSSHIHALLQCQLVKVTSTWLRFRAGVAEKLPTRLTRLREFQSCIWLCLVNDYKLMLCSQSCGATILNWNSQGRASHSCIVLSTWITDMWVQTKRFDWLRHDCRDFTLMITVFLRTPCSSFGSCTHYNLQWIFIKLMDSALFLCWHHASLL
jgi:hypothetical protein